MTSGSGTSAHIIGFFTKVPSKLPDGFSAASAVSKHDTNDSAIMNNLRILSEIK
jgi:hypothetical protein